MNKEVLTNKEVSDALHCLFHCARKDSNYETQYKQFRLVYDYINQLETNRAEAIEYIENIWYSKNTTNINDIGYTTNKLLKIKQLLERGKE